MKYFLFSMLITKLYQANDNILYIPKKINIYAEIPNGPQKFLDDFPILTIFETTHITLEKQLPLDISIKNLNKDLLWEDQDKMTYIEKKIYLNVIKYLSSDENLDISNFLEKIKKKLIALLKVYIVKN